MAQSVSLPGRRSFLAAGRGLALDLALGLAAQAIVDLLQNEAQHRLAAFHIVGEEMVEMVAHRILDEPRGFGLKSAGPWSGSGIADRG